MAAERVNQINKMFEYNLWANMRLFEVCLQLSDEQLAIEVKGVYGRIKPTLAHIVSGEGAYIKHLTGTRPWPDNMEWDRLSISELLEKAQLSGRRLIEIASQVDPATRHDVEYEGEQGHFFNWTVVGQAYYHGVEHRTQVKILLTQLGVAHPELDVWDYTDSLSNSEN